MASWYNTDFGLLMSSLKTSPHGLSKEEAAARLKKNGPNRLVRKPKKSPARMFIEQFRSVLVIVLIIAAIVSLVLGEASDAAAIGIIVVLNAALGFHQEYKAERAIEALRKMIVSKIIVTRDGKPLQVSAEELVPGDIVSVEEGDRIPADMRMMEVTGLRIDESALTGESVPVSKTVEKKEGEMAIGDRTNMGFMGTLVVSGRGKGIVVSTGMKTELGRIASLVQEEEEPTPLQKKMDVFGLTIGKISLGIASVIFVVGLMNGLEPFLIFLTAVSLAVAVIPEGLPAVTALTLSIGTQRMLKRNAVVRRLASVEALGSADVICSDKTGTMTTNEMTVRKIWFGGKEADVSGVGFEPKGDFTIDGKKIDITSYPSAAMLVRVGRLCNNAIMKNEGSWKVIGDPTEGALVVLADKARMKDDYKRVGELPFSSFRKRMTTINWVGTEVFAYSKGAPEVILASCKMTRAEKERAMEAVHRFASNGMRVLGMSYKRLGRGYKEESVEKDMHFVGLVAMIDPPSKETKEAIAVCKQAGIRTIMLTGDHKITARAIANEVGLEGDAVSGEDIDSMDEKEFEAKVKTMDIFARISPDHKLRIVKKLKSLGHIVAVSGDGVNDAPALKSAEIGVAMGIKGSDVAKEASSMVLLDDNFSSIVSAVEEGRGIYDNIKKFIKYLMAANTGEVLFITIPMVIGFGPALLPTLLPVQLLWMNLVTDGLPALALGMDPKEKDVMKRRPRSPKEKILDNDWLFVIASGITIFAVTMAAFMIALPQGIEKSRTMAFSTMVIFEIFLVFNCRSETRGVFRMNPINNKWLLLAAASSIILQVAVVQTSVLEEVFETVPLTIEDWVMVFGLSSVAFLIVPEVFDREIFRKKP
ncbi:MAG: HAD-IC family P-type ATPase [Candidatus Aenigmarchaeota archaeon]|nr:HAD-IC family P-type ATPase [Candidatus Aenigmarchaeota archaeon]